MKFGTAPTKGQPKDSYNDGFDWTKKDCVLAQFGAPSLPVIHTKQIYGHRFSDVKPLQLWTQCSKNKAMAEKMTGKNH